MSGKGRGEQLRKEMACAEKGVSSAESEIEEENREREQKKAKTRKEKTCKTTTTHSQKNKFTMSEDKLLTELVVRYFGSRAVSSSRTKEEEIQERSSFEDNDFIWETIASMIPNRNQRQCHDRWCYYLSPDIKKEPWTQEEEDYLIQLVKDIGPHWVKISKQIKGRTDTQIKNRWNVIRRRVEADKKNVNSSSNSNSNSNFNSTPSSSSSSSFNFALPKQIHSAPSAIAFPIPSHVVDVNAIAKAITDSNLNANVNADGTIDLSQTDKTGIHFEDISIPVMFDHEDISFEIDQDINSEFLINESFLQNSIFENSLDLTGDL